MMDYMKDKLNLLNKDYKEKKLLVLKTDTWITTIILLLINLKEENTK